MSHSKNELNPQKNKKIKKQAPKIVDNYSLTKENPSGKQQDIRFVKASYDPKFLAPSSKVSKIKIDKRFSKMMSDPAFTNRSKIDRYGRSVNPQQANNQLKEYYYMEEEKPEQQPLEESQQVGPDDVEDAPEGIQQWMQNYDEESSQLSDIPVDFDEQDIDRVWNDDSEHVIKGQDILATKRLALCNYDWMNISSKDLMLLFSSFKTNAGFIKSVKVYMSNIGKQKLQEEQKFGPQGIWRKDTGRQEQAQVKTQNWRKSWKQLLQNRQEQDNAFDEKKLREYQKTRLKYFYAVIECDSKRTADEIYKECDGNQFQNSNLPFDLRFIPDDLHFDKTNLKEECNQIPIGGQVKNFITKAMGHSKVSLSWEDPELSLAASLKKKNWNRLSEKELDEMDWSMYINEDDVNKEDGMKRIVNENINEDDVASDWKKSYNKKNRKTQNDIEIAFEGGFDTKSKKKGKNQIETEQEEISLKKKRKTMKERQRQHQEEKKKKRQQLQLLVQNNGKVEVNINLSDDRFKAVYDNPLYSIDPVDSRFDHRKSGKVFEQIVKRNKNKNQE